VNRKFKVIAAACSVQYMIVNVHTVCDVIIARSCGTLPAFAANGPLYFLPCFGLWCSCE